jgi:hypothetical protein
VSWLKPERGWLDHAILAFGAGAAGWGIGMSVNNPGIAMIFGFGAAASTMLGWVLSVFVEGSRFHKLDTWLWTLFAAFAFFSMRPLNGLLPGEGFPFQVAAAASMGFMLIFCGFVSWRDETLLFLSMPTLALFVLSGAIDSYALGNFFFSIFIVSAQFLYARAHRRAMLARAASSGGGDYAELRRGPWRWMAGPEWAFGSALATILVGIIIAPLFRESVRTVTGGARIALNRAVTPPPAPARTGTPPPEYTIGRGPNNPSDEIVLRVRSAGQRYLRTRTYEIYGQRGWRGLQASEVNAAAGASRRISQSPRSGGWVQGFEPGSHPLEPVESPRIVDLELIPETFNLEELPAPGPIVQVQEGISGSFLPDGRVLLRDVVGLGRTLRYRAQAEAGPADGEPAQLPAELGELEPYYETVRGASLRLIQDANRIAGGQISSDYAKAEALEKWIGAQARYNLNAAPTPPDVDPVEHFLYTSKEGYCDLYASSMALAARAAGMPARVAVGWLVSDIRPDERGIQIVRKRDYHMWAEIFFEGVGWVPFDPTAHAEEVEGSGIGDSVEPPAPPITQQPWFWPAVLTAFVGLGLGLGLLAARTIRAREDVRAVRQPLEGPVQKFFKAVEGAAGRPRRYSETIREFLARSEAALGENAPEAWRIGREIEDWAYGPVPPTSEQVAAFKVRLKSFIQALSQARAAAKAS